MKVRKRAGDIVDFDPEKLKRSLLKSEANAVLVEEIMSGIRNQLYDGIATKQLYKLAFKMLKKKSNAHAARYNLKTALELLGPSGFLFEKFVSHLFSNEDYKTDSNLILQGHCVSHEIDILVKKDNKIGMVECKFHSGKNVKSDVKVPMYILSRFNDVKEIQHDALQKHEYISDCWIVTNNRFTLDAITFASCMGLNLLSWDYPKKNSIRSKIDSQRLYPLTALTTLTRGEKESLLQLDIILVSELIAHRRYLYEIGLTEGRIKNIIKEAETLCRI